MDEIKELFKKYDGRRVTRKDAGGYSILDSDQLIEQLEWLLMAEAKSITSNQPRIPDAPQTINRIKKELERRGFNTA